MLYSWKCLSALNGISFAAAHFLCKKLKNAEMCVTETARGIIELLPYSFDVHLSRIDHPELEEKL